MYKPRIIAIMSTFEPSEAVVSRIQALSSQVDRLFVVIDDNTVEKYKLLQPVAGASVQIVPQTGNQGVARVLNAGVAATGAKPDDWLLLLDDDTDLHSSFIDDYAHQIIKHALDMKKTIVGPAIVHEGDRCALSASGKYQHESRKSGNAFVVKTAVISSGMLLSRNVFDKIGGLDESLFIDTVDYEFCLRASEHGVTTVQLREPAIIHRLGATSHHQFLGRTFKTTQHSPLRRRYYVRNSCSVAWRHKRRHWRFVAAVILHHVRTVTLIVLFENNRFSKLAGMLVGYRDFLAGRSGRIEG